MQSPKSSYNLYACIKVIKRCNVRFDRFIQKFQILYWNDGKESELVVKGCGNTSCCSLETYKNLVQPIRISKEEVQKCAMTQGNNF